MNIPRLLSLDVFRGLTIVLMILVNSPGNQTSYSWLWHSAWNGCTLADLVFPFFIFIMGVSIVFSLVKQQQANITNTKIIIKIIQRTVIIFLLGLFLNAFPHHFDQSVRILGVLQRIALCYFFAAMLFLLTSVRTQVVITLSILIFYWAMMMFIPVPDIGAGHLTMSDNLAAYVDRMLLTPQHMYHKTFDPEGILSTLPAIATALLGNLTGVWLLSNKTLQKKCWSMLFFGMLGLAAGWFAGNYFPINKALWTSSYVLFTTGLALIVFAIFYYVIDIKLYKTWSKPLEIFGVNAIAAYFLHIFFLKIQAMIHITLPDGTVQNLRVYFTNQVFGWATPKSASLMYSVSYILFWLVVLFILYRKKIFIKV